jgi:hypothetical protein
MAPIKPATAVGGGTENETDEVVVYGRRNMAIGALISNTTAILVTSFFYQFTGKIRF